MLILSNFSYATNLMLCSMKDKDISCMCQHKMEKKYAGLSISKVKKSCCNSETVVLSNSNTLNTVKSELCSNPLIVMYYLTNGTLNNSAKSGIAVYYGLPGQIPKADIPISISSLLI